MSDQESLNPYQAPVSAGGPPGAPGDVADAERVRREYLKLETNMRSLGLLQLLGGFTCAIAAVAQLLDGGVLLGAALAALAGLSAATGVEMRRLSERGRQLAIVSYGVGMISIPVGTIVGGLVVYHCVWGKGRFVFTRDYAAVMAATPHIKYRSRLAVIVAVVFGLSLLAGVIAVLFSR